MSVSQKKVLVSGTNGFVGCYVVRNLLEKGYFVRGMVRPADKGKHLTRLFEQYGDKFELAMVPDITEEGAFDQTVKGMTAILHTASPFNYKSDDPRVEEQSVHAPDVDKYCAGKSLAERAAWDFKNTNDVPWDVVMLCQPFIFGPVIHECSRPEDLNESVDVLYKAVIKGFPDEAALVRPGANWIDVLDLAEAHSLALEKPAAGGHQFIVTAGPHVLQEFVNIARALDVVPTSILPRQVPERELPGPIVTYDTAKSKNILGLRYRSKEDMMTRFLEDLKRRGRY
ncbi:hypothetical protein C8R44DRAFT_819470 [Mycena epipterygia]|nr:hypothetical protein C8R44DRAFT_819470 [Mycena epipterygia]